MRWVARLDAFFGSVMSWRLTSLVVVGTTVLVSVLAVPVKVTVDGILYLASAKSLFNAHFTTDFAWFREPGYPLFLRAIHFFGSDAMYILIAQAACMGLAVLIALYGVRVALGRGAPSLGGVIVTALLTLNPMFLIYSSLVLQQALFTLQLALFALGFVLALKRPLWLPRWLLVVLVALNYVLAIWTSIGWIYLGLFPVVLSVVALFWPYIASVVRHGRTLGPKVARVLVAVVVALALTGGVYEVGLQVYSGWQAVKAPYLKHLTIPGAVIEPLSTAPPIPGPMEFAQRMGALMHMGEILPYYASENELFLKQVMVEQRAVGDYDTAYVNKPYTTYAANWISLPDSSTVLHYFYAKVTAKLSPICYVATFIGFLLAIVLSLVRRRWALALLLAIPLSFLAVYALSNSPIDRYGIPAYAWAVVSVGLLVSWLREGILWIRGRKGGSSAPAPSRDVVAGD